MPSFRTINTLGELGRGSDRIYWRDEAGVTHACEAAEVHPGLMLIWTLCERDVPNDGIYRTHIGAPSCPECRVYWLDKPLPNEFDPLIECADNEFAELDFARFKKGAVNRRRAG